MAAWWRQHGVVEALARELGAWALHGRVQRIRQLDALRVCMDIHQRGVTRPVVLDAEAGCVVATSSDPAREPAAPPAFQGLLRKHLANARVVDAHAPGDACSALVLETPAGRRTLLAEWPAGRGGNVLLLHEDGRILGASVPANLRARGLRMGQPYVPLPPPGPGDGAAAAPTVDASELATHALADLPTHAAVELLRHGPAETTGHAPAPHVELRRRLKAARSRAARLVDALAGDLARAAEAEGIRAAAERAKVQRDALPRGVSTWTLHDPWDADAAPVEVGVDAALGPAANVEKLFHRARRLARTAEVAGTRMVEARARLDALDRAMADLDTGDDGAVMRAESLLEGGRAPARPVKGQAPARRMPFRAFRTPQGHRVLVGRDRADNDTLTHRTARGRDIFLHARDFPGAHAILVVENSQPVTSSAVEHAALLAARFSEARNERAVDVRYTEVKHVRAIPGSPGRVTLARERVVRVRLDDPVLQVLLATEEGADSRMGSAAR